jgi:hypothetical protein
VDASDGLVMAAVRRRERRLAPMLAAYGSGIDDHGGR